MDADQLKEEFSEIKLFIEELQEKFDVLSDKVDALSGSDIAERLTEAWSSLSQAEEKINSSYKKFHELINDNGKRFCTMVNEFKGLVAQERANQVRKRKTIVKFLEEIGEL